MKPRYIRLSSYDDNRFCALSKSTVIKYDRLISMYSGTDTILHHYYFYKNRVLSDTFKPRKSKPMNYYYDDISVKSLLYAAKRSFYGKFK